MCTLVEVLAPLALTCTMSCLQEEGVIIVIGGLVKVAYNEFQGTSQTYYLGVGGIFGLYSALTGAAPCLPAALAVVVPVSPGGIPSSCVAPGTRLEDCRRFRNSIPG